jgi:hypothetical protein
MQAIAATYEAFNLGKHRPGGLRSKGSIFLYSGSTEVDSQCDSALPRDTLSDACNRLKRAAPDATDDARCSTHNCAIG